MLVGNNLTVLPAGVSQLRALRVLNLQQNRLVHVDPRAFSRMATISRLQLDDNQLTELPISMLRLRWLELLSVRNNRYAYITKLFYLKYLWLDLFSR
jgi:Leucine-rich repeat (LRR) protein